MKISIDGGEPDKITHFTDGQNIYYFDWSPDRKKLAMVRGKTRTDAVLIRNFR